MFENYFKRLKLFFKANKVKGEEQTVAFLVLIGPKVFNLVTDLCSPTDPEILAFKDVIEKLQQHYKPRSNIVFSRNLFHESINRDY